MKNEKRPSNPTGPPMYIKALAQSSSFLILQIAAFGSCRSVPRVTIHSIESPYIRTFKRMSQERARNVTGARERMLQFLN